jgi:hypothetical protein
MSTIQVVKDDAGWRVEYFGRTAGWIRKLRKTHVNSPKFYAEAVHGKLNYFNTINSARSFIIKNYH